MKKTHLLLLFCAINISLASCSSKKGSDGDDIDYYRILTIVAPESTKQIDSFTQESFDRLGASKKEGKCYFTYLGIRSFWSSYYEIPESYFPFGPSDFEGMCAFTAFRFGNIYDDYRYWNFYTCGAHFVIDEKLFGSFSKKKQLLIDVIFIPEETARQYNVNSEYEVRIGYHWRYPCDGPDKYTDTYEE